ncbi:MAG: T9SS type A sorting domain-containing protein, partial [Bacteroidota bacterium]
TTSTGDYSQDNRVQACTTPDGSRVFVEWSDSPLNAGGDNTIPDVLACGYNVDSKLWTLGKNFTTDDLTWSGACTFPSVGFAAFRNGTTSTIPVVITKFNISGSADDPVEFHYFNNVSFDDSEFQYDKINSINNINKASYDVRVSPNPAVDFITVNSEKLNGSTVRVMNVLGQQVISTMAQNQTIQLSLNGLASGVYMVEVSNNDGTVTKRIIKK